MLLRPSSLPKGLVVAMEQTRASILLTLLGLVTFFFESLSFPACTLGARICHRFAVRIKVKNDGMFHSIEYLVAQKGSTNPRPSPIPPLFPGG